MCLLSKNYVYSFIFGVYILPLITSSPQPQVIEKADQIFDAARQTVTDVVGVAQGAVDTAIGAAKNQVITQIDTVQSVAKIGVEAGRSVIELGEDTILRTLNGIGKK